MGVLHPTKINNFGFGFRAYALSLLCITRVLIFELDLDFNFGFWFWILFSWMFFRMPTRSINFPLESHQTISIYTGIQSEIYEPNKKRLRNDSRMPNIST